MVIAESKRKYPRIYLKVEVRGKIEDSAGILGHSRDISEEGIFIETTKTFAPDSTLSLNFKLPYLPEPVEVLGKIVWMKSAEQERASEDVKIPRWVRLGVGVHFERMNGKSRLLLNRYLEGEHELDSDDYTLADFLELPDKDIFAKTIPCLGYVEDYGRKGYRTYRRPLLSSCSNRVIIFDEETGREKKMIMMGSNNYLGLTTHPKVIKAAAEAIKKYGVGSGGVPQLSGTYDLTCRLEEKLAKWKSCEDAIVFSTGYSANVGTISALVKKDDAIIVDHLAHSSIIDGCLLSKAHIYVFKHNDLFDLENILKNCDSNCAGKIIIVDSVYSMDGDVAPLPQIKNLAEKYRARIMVDEAHASGVIGRRGRGITDYFDMEGEVDIISGTLSKAFGGVGGFVASSKEVVNYLRYYAHSYFFSTSLPPSIVASLLAAIEVIDTEPQLRDRLWHNIRYMKEGLRSLGFNIGDTESAIIPILIADELILRKMSKRIHQMGVYLNPVPYPAVPKGKSRFRLSLMATHTQDDLDETLEVLEKAGREFGVISSSKETTSNSVILFGSNHKTSFPSTYRRRESPPERWRAGSHASLDYPNESGNDMLKANLDTNDKSLTLKVLKSITEISQEEWNSIVGEDRIICSYNYLRAVEESGINDCDYRYLLVYDGGKLIAHTCAYAITFELDTLAKGVIKSLISLIRRIFPRFLKLRFVECGTPVALGNTISFAEDALKTDKKAALGVIVRGMEEFAREEKINLTLLRDFTKEQTLFFDSLKDYGYTKVSNLPNAVMDCQWASFEGYLNSLRSHYRFKLRKHLKAAADNCLYIEVKDDYGDLAPKLLQLWRNTYERAKEYRREILTEAFFQKMNFYLKGKAKVILLKKDENVLSFSLVLEDENVLRFMFVGMDYEYNEKYSVYFNSLYNVVKFAIDEGKKKIDLGITTIFSKTDLGAEVEPLFMYMKHKNYFLNLIITSIFKFMTPKTNFTPKNVFRE